MILEKSCSKKQDFSFRLNNLYADILENIATHQVGNFFKKEPSFNYPKSIVN